MKKILRLRKSSMKNVTGGQSVDLTSLSNGTKWSSENVQVGISGVSTVNRSLFFSNSVTKKSDQVYYIESFKRYFKEEDGKTILLNTNGTTTITIPKCRDFFCIVSCMFNGYLVGNAVKIFLNDTLYSETGYSNNNGFSKNNLFTNIEDNTIGDPDWGEENYRTEASACLISEQNYFNNGGTIKIIVRGGTYAKISGLTYTEITPNETANTSCVIICTENL